MHQIIDFQLTVWMWMAITILMANVIVHNTLRYPTVPNMIETDKYMIYFYRVLCTRALEKGKRVWTTLTICLHSTLTLCTCLIINFLYLFMDWTYKSLRTLHFGKDSIDYIITKGIIHIFIIKQRRSNWEAGSARDMRDILKIHVVLGVLIE